MRHLGAPFLEIGFYFGKSSETDAFTRLVKALTDLGAWFTDDGYAHLGLGVRDASFSSITERAPRPVAVKSLGDIERYFADPDTRLIQVYMSGVTGTVHHVAEIVTYLSVSPEAAQMDRHPLAIWTEGWMFSGPPHFLRRHAKQAKKVGGQIYQRFKTLVETLQPSYGAITIEEALECPADLRHDPRSYAFQDFFVKRTFLGAPNCEHLRDLFADAYIEPVDDGLYISSHGDFNPKDKSLDTNRALEQSVEVAKMIGSAGKQGTT